MTLTDIKQAIGVEPYHEEPVGLIYCGDCLDILPKMPKGCVDLVVTDPPYPDYNKDHGKGWSAAGSVVAISCLQNCHQFIFWPADRYFYWTYTAIHIWHKPNGQSQLHYEKIYERNGKNVYRVWRIPIINYQSLPEWIPHPTQKPIKLISAILKLTDSTIILDPFLGSGTTAVAAKQLGRKFVGIEIEEKYCKIAVQRLAQEILI